MSLEETITVSMARLLRFSLRPSRTKITALVQPTYEEYDPLTNDWENPGHVTPDSPFLALPGHDFLWNDTPLPAEPFHPKSLHDKIDLLMHDEKATLPDSYGTEDDPDDDIFLHDHEDFCDFEFFDETCDEFGDVNDLVPFGEDSQISGSQISGSSSPVWDDNVSF
jgi:hypothetical protein